ncbi:MAG: hypothetical protein JXR60_11735 [Bacteroidales bacterium]|nr:hypothetical protein [Bacteroidales bacterium]
MLFRINILDIDYRFGFNGQEKDDEVFGTTGSSYTTEFRALDSRIGRWWSLDPYMRANISMYSAFSNNPIIFVDPRGDDDYYSSDGKYLGSDNRNTNEIRIVSDETVGKAIIWYMFSAVKPTQTDLVKLYQDNNTKLIEFQFDNSNSSSLGKIISHYNKKSSIVRTKVGGIAPLATSPLGKYYTKGDEDFKGKLGIQAGMWATGKAFSELYNSNDVRSLLVHENWHLEHDYVLGKNYPGYYWSAPVDINGGDEAILRHLKAYNAQIEDESWSNVSKGFMKWTLGAVREYVDNLSDDKKNEYYSIYKEKYGINLGDYEYQSSIGSYEKIMTDE